MDVDNHHIRVMGKRLANEVPCVARSGDDIETRGGEDVDNAVAKKRLVLADYNADGSTFTHPGFDRTRVTP
jgi:hypothetical protein